MWEIYNCCQRLLKSCPKSNKSLNLVTLLVVNVSSVWAVLAIKWSASLPSPDDPSSNPAEAFVPFFKIFA